MPGAPKVELLLPKATLVGRCLQEQPDLIGIDRAVGRRARDALTLACAGTGKQIGRCICVNQTFNTAPGPTAKHAYVISQTGRPHELYKPHSTVFWATPVIPPEAENLNVTTAEEFACDKTIGVKLLVIKNIRVLAGTVKVTLPDATSPPVATLALRRLPLVSYELHCNCPKAIVAEQSNDSTTAETEPVL